MSTISPEKTEKTEKVTTVVKKSFSKSPTKVSKARTSVVAVSPNRNSTIVVRDNAHLTSYNAAVRNSVRVVSPGRLNRSVNMAYGRFNIVSELNTQDIIYQDRDIEIERLKTTVFTLNKKLSIMEDVQRENARVLQENKLLRIDQGKMRTELEKATEYILNMEEKVYKSNKISLELLKQLKDSEVEINSLQGYTIPLQHRIPYTNGIYVPQKADATDKALADFLNNYPERSLLKVMFIRENENLYTFGSKKVHIKVENNNIKIRVGGGYLSIEEFLDQYTPVELEKLERKDPTYLKRMSERLSVQDATVTVVNRKSLRNTSPYPAAIERRTTSPGRMLAV